MQLHIDLPEDWWELPLHRDPAARSAAIDTLVTTWTQADSELLPFASRVRTQLEQFAANARSCGAVLAAQHAVVGSDGTSSISVIVSVNKDGADQRGGSMQEPRRNSAVVSPVGDVVIRRLSYEYPNDDRFVTVEFTSVGNRGWDEPAAALCERIAASVKLL